ncbi:hypothetical protein BDF20DRAFT_917711 [Mycotypha africana]|uniref:uncharacterized protein n=1 Tax=Mycotypha africana TaxID=64632 RepID=UPI0023008C19|nr:uncharacterized protein BDF20DRAFT_917711 [Mycotypha africana]KAI8967235.1 hypothetical protein BDF20DRAFT_917711 [Mycotypha africana]
MVYKAYVCYGRNKWLMVLGCLINAGYIALISIYASVGKVPTSKDIFGNCVMNYLDWPALVKLGLDIASNTFLSVVFLIVIYRYYKVFSNSLYKSLLANGVIFSVGVIVSNIVTAILISCRIMGGLSADLYCFDWVITSYLLIKQFKVSNQQKETDIFDMVPPIRTGDEESESSSNREKEFDVVQDENLAKSSSKSNILVMAEANIDDKTQNSVGYETPFQSTLTSTVTGTTIATHMNTTQLHK